MKFNYRGVNIGLSQKEKYILLLRVCLQLKGKYYNWKQKKKKFY